VNDDSAPLPTSLSVELPKADRTNSAKEIDARWSDDGSRILVARTVDPRVWPLLDAARPDIGALCIVVGLVLLVVGTARVLRTPRLAGRSYCRRCNHDLNAVVGVRPDPPRCPECGLALEGRGSAPGRSRGRRLARVIVPALLAIGGGTALFATSITRRQAPLGGPALLPAWPIAAASNLGNWSWWRRSTIDTPERFALRIDIIRVDTDRLWLEAPVLATRTRQWIARTDGAMVAWADFSERSEWHPRVEWFESGRGRGGRADLGPQGGGFPSICGWSPDGREIIALLQRTGTDYPMRDDGTAVFAVDVMAIDPDTGTVRTVDRGRGRATGGPPGGWLLGPAIAAVGIDPTARTVTLAGEQVGQGNGTSRGGVSLRELTVVGNGGTRIVTLDGSIVEDAYGFRRAWIEADGRLGVEFASSFMSANPASQGGPKRLVDLDTGKVTEPPSIASAPSDMDPAPRHTVIADPTKPSIAGKLSPDGSRRFNIEIDWSTTAKITQMRVRVDRVDR